jgi:hypothetical protein
MDDPAREALKTIGDVELRFGIGRRPSECDGSLEKDSCMTTSKAGHRRVSGFARDLDRSRIAWTASIKIREEQSIVGRIETQALAARP